MNRKLTDMTFARLTVKAENDDARNESGDEAAGLRNVCRTVKQDHRVGFAPFSRSIRFGASFVFYELGSLWTIC
jgi:hypothetical protein